MAKENPGWWSRNVDRVIRPEQQTEAQARRAPWVLLAFLAVLAVVAVGVWALRVYVFEPSQTAEPTPAAPTASADGPKDQGTELSDAGCTLETTDKDISSTPPEATQWVVERWAALPEVDGAGPCIEQDGYRTGFAHTQTGAVLAAYHYFVLASPDTADSRTRSVAEYALLDGPLKEEILKKIDAVNNGVETRYTDADLTSFVLRGYKIDYAGDTAIVELLAGSADGSVTSGGTLKLVWQDDDWRVDPASGDSLEASAPDARIGDFVIWEPTAAGTQ